jgi:hypothetical protein
MFRIENTGHSVAVQQKPVDCLSKLPILTCPGFTLCYRFPSKVRWITGTFSLGRKAKINVQVRAPEAPVVRWRPLLEPWFRFDVE